MSSPLAPKGVASLRTTVDRRHRRFADSEAIAGWVLVSSCRPVSERLAPGIERDRAGRRLDDANFGDIFEAGVGDELRQDALCVEPGALPAVERLHLTKQRSHQQGTLKSVIGNRHEATWA